MHAFIYARFSTLEQARGTSLIRQLTDCRAFCEAKEWQWSEDRQIVDEGRSAYHGANRSEGSELADFEKRALAGALPKDAVLVVERLDRLSRQSSVEVFNLISRLTEAGVAIATVDGARVYTRGSFDFSGLIELIVKAHVAHEESEKKSQRLSAAWSAKRAAAQSGARQAITRRCPAWLEVNSNGTYLINHDRASILRRIFNLCIDGFGKHLIASTFNDEGIPTWGGRTRGWHASYIQKLLSSRSSVGEYQSYTKRSGSRVAIGEPIRGFFPAVIDHATFARAQVQKAKRTALRGQRGMRINNLFAGLATCGHCGGVMIFRNKGSNERYLVCGAAIRRAGCSNTMHFNYPALERSVVAHTLHLALDDRHFSAPANAQVLEEKCAIDRDVIISLRQREARLIDLLSRIESEEIENQLRQLGSEIERAKEELAKHERELALARGTIAPREQLKRMRKLVGQLDADDDAIAGPARATAQQALRELLDGIVCDPISGSSAISFTGEQIVINRNGELLSRTNGVGLQLQSLMDLRDRGWIVKSLIEHPALGKAKTACGQRQ